MQGWPALLPCPAENNRQSPKQSILRLVGSEKLALRRSGYERHASEHACIVAGVTNTCVEKDVALTSDVAHCAQTVAALALLFAIHAFQPSPFFVLDEIDAALDATNVARVARYIHHHTRPAGEVDDDADSAPDPNPMLDPASRRRAPRPRFQSIVISLKDALYEKADALIGVSRDADSGASTMFTFDLSAFAE